MREFAVKPPSGLRGYSPCYRQDREFFYALQGLKQKITVITVAGVMGGDVVQEIGFKCELLESPDLPEITELFQTSADLTKFAAQQMKDSGVAMILFVGGDGTARNIFEAVGTEIPCLGIPAGVKIHSSVFAINPKDAGLLTLAYLWGEAPLREAEVLDIDEDAFEIIALFPDYMVILQHRIYLNKCNDPKKVLRIVKKSIKIKRELPNM